MKEGKWYYEKHLQMCKRLLSSSPFKEIDKKYTLIISKLPINKQYLEIYLAKKLVLDVKLLNSYQSILISYLNHMNIDENIEITRNLMEFSSKTLKKQLYKIVMLSKEYNDISMAASNAATILNKIGFSFSWRNMRGVRIPYADLTKGRFIETDFSSSDLRYTDFTNSNIISANFKDASLPSTSGIELLLSCSINDEWKIEKIEFSQCKKYMAILIYKTGAYFNFCKNIKVFRLEGQVEPRVLELEQSNTNYQAWLSFSIDSQAVYLIDTLGKLTIWDYHESLWQSFEAYPYTRNKWIEPCLSSQYLVYFFMNTIWIKSLPSLDVAFKIPFEARSINLIISQSMNNIAWNTDTRAYIFSFESWSIEKEIKTTGKLIFLQKNIMALYNKINKRYEIWDTTKQEMIYKYDATPRNSNGIKLLSSADGRFLIFWIYNKIIFLEFETQIQTKIYLIDQVSMKAITTKFNTILVDWGMITGLNKLGWRLLKHSQTDEKFDIDNISEFLIKSINWSPCGKFVWLLYYNGIIKEWDMKKKKWRTSFDFSKTRYKACSISGNMVGIIDEFCMRIKIWDIYTQKKIKMIILTDSEDDIEEFVISAANNRAYILGKFQSIYIIDIEIGQVIWTYPKSRYNCLVSAFFGDYYACSKSNYMVFLDIKNDIAEPIKFECEEIIKIIPSPSNQWISLLAINPYVIFLLNWNDKTTKKFGCGEKQETACFSPLEKYLASSSSSQIILWDIKEESIVAKTYRYYNSPSYIAYSPLGKYIALSISGDSIMIYNHKKCLKEYKGKKLDDQNCDFKLEIKLELAMVVS